MSCNLSPMAERAAGVLHRPASLFVSRAASCSSLPKSISLDIAVTPDFTSYSYLAYTSSSFVSLNLPWLVGFLSLFALTTSVIFFSLRGSEDYYFNY